MSRFLSHVKERIEERRVQATQHDFVAEVAPSRLNATRRSLNLGHRRDRSSGSPTPGFGGTRVMKRSNSHSSVGIATAGSDALDLEILFLSAQGLPRMDVVGAGCDPYFRAGIDEAIEYTSRALPSTLNPEWNEVWRVRNVPALAIIKVRVYDKDENQYLDDYIGKFKITDVYVGGRREIPITNLIRSKPASPPAAPAYMFDGPCRYAIHLSPTVGAFTVGATSARRYSTWKIHIRGIQTYFGDKHQHWNRDYRAAQAIFSGPLSITVRAPIIAGHRLLYARTTANQTGILNDAEDFWSLFRARINDDHRQGLARLVGAGAEQGTPAKCPICNRETGETHSLECAEAHLPDNLPSGPGARSNTSTGGRVPQGVQFGAVTNLASASAAGPHEHVQRIKPAVYTYIIDEDTFRFSETGAAFFVDFASKHALHSSCAEEVRYAGEFHPRPDCGWANFREDMPDHSVNWELWIDNGSGTYAPTADLLGALKGLLEYNWPGLVVRAWDFRSEEQKKSIQECRDYALRFRGIMREELEPSVLEGEKESSLWKMASVRR
ncbi:hypothetical protein FRC06_000571 [Ceratobasidium sp. 370]|nr:hypothetical protein FRC06_000571 [Ceratobasidium sp. 370]